MIRKVVPKNLSIKMTWLISYFFVLIVPVLITGITYVITVDVIRNEINHSNTLLLKRVQQQMDALLNDVERLSQEIAFNPDINQLLRAQIKPNILKPYNVYEYVKDLRSYKLINPSIEDFYIYFNDLGFVLSTEIGTDSRSFYESNFYESGLSYESWRTIVSRQYKGNFIDIDYKSQRNEGVLFIRTIPFNYSGGPFANIIIKLNESRFMEGAGDIESLSHGNLLIMDRNNNILMAAHPIKTMGQLKYETLSGESGLVREKVDGSKSVVSYISSQFTDWKYVTVVPESIFLERAEYVRNLTIISLMLCLLLGGVITYYSLKKNYNPVDQVVKLLEKHLGSSFDKKNNEYVFIQQSIDRTFQELEKVDAILAQQNKLLRSHLISSILKGDHQGVIPLQERLELHEINFTSDCFAVMTFYIDDFGDGLHPELCSELQSDPMTEFKKAQIIIVNTVEKLFGEKDPAFMVEMDDMLVCLVNFVDTDLPRAKSLLSRVATETQAFLGNQYHLHVLISASSIHQTLAGIPEAYNEALQVMEYKKLLGIEDTIHFEDISELPKGNYYYPLEKEYQLINLVRVGDAQGAKVILEEIFEKNFQGGILPVKIARCLMFNMVSTMIKTLNEASGAGYSGFVENLNPIERLLNCESIVEMREEMHGILDVFCEYVQSKNKIRNKNADKELIESVKAYIEANYTDLNLAITAIAERFRVNPVYLSKVFREYNDESLLDFINKIRIQQAKQLFKEEGFANLDRVAEAVGYFSTRTFTRAFKKYEGVTPGKYKESK